MSWLNPPKQSDLVANNRMSDAPANSSSLILYQTEDRQTRVQRRFEKKSVWLAGACNCLFMHFIVLCLCFVNCFVEAKDSPKKAVAEPGAIDVSGFRDSAHHWREIRDESRFIKAEPNQPSYAPAQVREIVTNLLLFQRDNGGWPKDYDMTAILTEAQKTAVLATRSHTDTSYDNGNLHSQVAYLARAYAQT